MELAPGTLVADRYLVARLLGQGGAGWVYLARDTRFDSDIALKVAAPDLGDEGAFAARVRREAKIGYVLGKLPGIVRCLDWGTLPAGGLFMTLELVEGASPLDLLSGSRSQVLQRLVVAATRVGMCHRKSVVHRDVKPQNFLVSARGVIFLGDFGSAKTIGRRSEPAPGEVRDPTLTEPGTLLGTPVYMSPEQFRDPASVDPRADVFSLGVMLYHALTKELPYKGRSAMEIMSNQALVESGLVPPPRPPRELVAGVPEAIDRLCMAAISLAPDQRPADAVVFAEELAAAAGLPRPGGPHATTRPAVARPGTPLTREALSAALGVDVTGFLAAEQLRAGLTRVGPARARDLVAQALSLLVTDERPVEGVTRYLGRVALTAPTGRVRVTVGRTPDCDLPLELVTVSKLHLVFEREGPGWVVVDQGSSNGTTVNGGKLMPGARQPLSDGDELRLSDHVTLTVAGWPRLAAALGLESPGA